MLVSWRVSDQIIQIVSRKTGVHRRNPRWRKKTSHPGARWVESTRDSRNRWGEQELLEGLHPGRLTWKLQITHFEGKMIFQTSMILFHVNLQGCRWWQLKYVLFSIRTMGKWFRNDPTIGGGGGNSHIFGIFTPEPWGRWSNLTSTFFKWVGSTTKYFLIGFMFAHWSIFFLGGGRAGQKTVRSWINYLSLNWLIRRISEPSIVPVRIHVWEICLHSPYKSTIHVQ